MERFIKEYANCQIRFFMDNGLMESKFKEIAINTINGALKARERNLITVDEAVKMIADPIYYGR